MKILFAISVSLILCQMGHAGPRDTIRVMPGQGIDSIRLLLSSPEEVQVFRKVSWKKRETGSIACGSKSYVKNNEDYQNDSLGILFHFETPWMPEHHLLEKKKKMQVIRLRKNNCAVYGLTIGKSTKTDVMNYVACFQCVWEDEHTIRNVTQGIGFRFNKNWVLEEMYVFPPGSTSTGYMIWY